MLVSPGLITMFERLEEVVFCYFRIVNCGWYTTGRVH